MKRKRRALKSMGNIGKPDSAIFTDFAKNYFNSAIPLFLCTTGCRRYKQVFVLLSASSTTHHLRFDFAGAKAHGALRGQVWSSANSMLCDA